MTFSLYPLLVAKFQLIDVSALFNEVIFENGGNRKPVFYGQVLVKFIETLNYYKIWSKMICACWWGNFLSKERSLIIYCLYWIFIVLIWQNNRASSAANWYLFNGRRIYGGCTPPFKNFFDLWLRSSRYEKYFLPVLSKLSQASLVKIFHFSD